MAESGVTEFMAAPFSAKKDDDSVARTWDLLVKRIARG
jgi:hypothetical protein